MNSIEILEILKKSTKNDTLILFCGDFKKYSQVLGWQIYPDGWLEVETPDYYFDTFEFDSGLHYIKKATKLEKVLFGIC